MRFDTAIYRTEAGSETVTIENIDINSYLGTYRNHLFCPNPMCQARLKYVPKIKGPFFQSIDLDEHIKGCLYRKDYKQYDNDGKVKKTFSQDHILRALKRQMKKFGLGSLDNAIHIQTNHDKKEVKHHDEPPILYYPAEKVDEKLKSKAVCVGGLIKSVSIVDEDIEKIHAYINFELDGKKVSVLISNRRYVQDKRTSEIVNDIRKRWRETPRSKNCACLCFGWVKCVAKGINVVPINLDSICIGYK